MFRIGCHLSSSKGYLAMGKQALEIGSIFEVKSIAGWTVDFLLPASAPGAFIIVGCILAAKSYFSRRAAIKAGRLYVPPKGLDCRQCGFCKFE